MVSSTYEQNTWPILINIMYKVIMYIYEISDILLLSVVYLS